MNPTLAAAKQKALEINESVNKMATQQGKATQSFDSAGNRTMTPAINASNVPASLVDGTVQSVQMPQPPAIQTDMGVVAEGRTLLDQETARAQAEAQQATAKVSDSERAVREQFGILQTEEQARGQLEERAGVNAFSQDLRKFQESLRRQMADLDQFDVDNVNTLEQMRVDASKRDITKRTFSAMSAEANIQNAVQRANKVAATRATIAAIDVTQGNLQAAKEQVDKALKAVYEPVRQQLQMEMFFLERNDRRFDGAQKDLANTRMMQIQREQAMMERTMSSVDDALSTGAATPGEVQKLASPDTPDDVRLALAQLIKSRGATEMRNLQMQSSRLDMAVKAEQLAKLRQPVVATRETSVIDVNGNKQLVDTQTGEVIASFGADVSVNEVQKARDINFVNTLDSLIDHPGMAKAVGTNPFARFTPFRADVTTGQVSDFVGSVENIVKVLTLNTYAEAKAKGMTFGAMSEGEWNILGSSATKLSTWRREREDGSIFYDTSEQNMKAEINVLSNFGKMDALRKGVDPASIGVLVQPDGTYWTRNSDGTYTQLEVTAPQ